MKILITTEYYYPTINGVVTSVMNLRKELLKLGHEVKILTLSTSGESHIEEDVIYVGSKTAQIIYPDARFTFTIGDRCFKEIEQWQPDIIHTQSEFSTFLIAKKIAKKFEIPIIHTYHTIYEDYSHYFSPVKKWGKKIVSAFTNTTLKHTQCVIAPSEKVKEILSNYGINKEVIVIPTGIDLDTFGISAKKSNLSKLRDRFGIADDVKILITIGRIAKEKNQEEILDFLKRLNRKDIKLVIVGDGPNRSYLEAHAKALGIDGQVVFVGMIPHETIGSFYQMGDIFVSASSSETQGLTYFEALANGVPVICRKDPCLKNVVYNGVNGWQYESFEQFKKKIDEVLDHTRDKLSQEALKSIQEKYSLSAFASKIEKAYIKVIATHTSD